MRIALIEEDKILLGKLNLLLYGEADLEVVAAFTSAEEALEKLGEVSPEAMLVDTALHGISGIELIKAIKKRMPEIEVVAFSGIKDRQTVISAIKAGASGYILKEASPRELIEAFHDLCNGGAPMSPIIARTLIKELQQEDCSDEELILSNREKDIFRHLEKGLSYKEMAGNLNISHHTVHAHVKNIYSKLQANGRIDALQKARKNGVS